MPRSFSSGIAAAFGGLLLLSACVKTPGAALGRKPARGPLTVTVTCDNGVTIGLTDSAGDPAWAFEAKGSDKVEWQGSPSVTNILIEPKKADHPLPLDSAAKGIGKPARSTVKARADTGVYAYKIIATCKPTVVGKDTVVVTLDPDMIIL
jgi:hypothetical protein